MFPDGNDDSVNEIIQKKFLCCYEIVLFLFTNKKQMVVIIEILPLRISLHHLPPVNTHTPQTQTQKKHIYTQEETQNEC